MPRPAIHAPPPTPAHPTRPAPQAINRTSEIIECTQARVPLDRILGLQSFDLEKILAMDPAFLRVRYRRAAPWCRALVCASYWDVLQLEGAAEGLWLRGLGAARSGALRACRPRASSPQPPRPGTLPLALRRWRTSPTTGTATATTTTTATARSARRATT